MIIWSVNCDISSNVAADQKTTFVITDDRCNFINSRYCKTIATIFLNKYQSVVSTQEQNRY